MKQTIAVVIYSNPDYLPPSSSAIRLLSNKYNVVVISRSQDEASGVYPENVELIRLGKHGTAIYKEKQPFIIRIAEYILFLIKVRCIVRRRRCSLVYGFDNHGFIAAFFASRVFRHIPLIYHNLDIYSSGKFNMFSWIMERAEFHLLRFAEAAVFCNSRRKEYFASKTAMPGQIFIAMNAPLRLDILPKNRLSPILLERGFPENVKVVFYQGAINRDHFIVEIIRSMKQWPLDSVLVMCGIALEDYKDKLYREIEKSDFNKRIIILPYVQHSELKFYTSGASLGLALFNFGSGDLNLSSMAGASNKFFEYFAAGVPVLTNSGGDFNSLIQDDAVYTAESVSEIDIGNAINSALSDVNELNRRKLIARRLHLDKFNYEMQMAPVLSFLGSELPEDN